MFVCDTVYVVVPDAKGLSNPPEVEALREKVYASLESYTKQKYPDQPGRCGTQSTMTKMFLFFTLLLTFQLFGLFD